MIGDTKTLEPRDETETLLPPVRDEDDTEMRRSKQRSKFYVNEMYDAETETIPRH